MVKKGLLVIVLSSGRKPALENVITVQKNATNSAKNNESGSWSKATPAETCGSLWGLAKHGSASLCVQENGASSETFHTECFESKVSERSVVLLTLWGFF